MINYIEEKLSTGVIKELILLSQMWVAEDCSHGMVANTENDLLEPLFVARDGERIVGYIFGHFYTTESKNSYIELGRECFSVDELYVLPKYRSQGIGRELFRRIEEAVSEKCDYITLSTSTKNYKAVLHFYVEELDMNFHSAYLIKAIK